VAVIYSPQTLAAALQFYERLLARIQPDQRVGGDAWLAAGTVTTRHGLCFECHSALTASLEYASCLQFHVTHAYSESCLLSDISPTYGPAAESSHVQLWSAPVAVQGHDKLTCRACRLPQRRRGHAGTCAR